MVAASAAISASSPVSIHLKEPAKLNGWHKYVTSPDPILAQLNKDNTAFARFKAALTTHSNTYKEVIKLSEKTGVNEQWPGCLSILQDAFSAPDFHQMKIPLRKILVGLTEAQRKELFETLVRRSMENQNFASLKNCLDLVSWEELHQMLDVKADGIATMVNCLAQCENDLRKKTETHTKMTSESGGTHIANLVHGILDTLLMSMSFFEIGKEPNTSWDASYLLKSYGEILGAPLALFTALSTVLPIATAIIITAAAVLAVVLLLMAYVKWWKPCPENINPCTNLTTAARQGKLDQVIGRDEDINKLIASLSATSSGIRCHPILVGKSGVGKTEIVKGLALRIAQGTVPDCLKDKKIFMVNTGNLMQKDPDDSQDRIQRIVTRLGKHKDKAIIFIDEIQTCMVGNKTLCEKLKNVLDTSPNSLPYCIAATNEYEKVANDPAFARRFVQIHIDETNKPQTEWILREMLQKSAGDVYIPDECLKKIVHEHQPDKGAQPAAAKRILAQAISKLQLQQSGYYSSDELSALEGKRESLMAAIRLNPCSEQLQELMNIENAIQEKKQEQVRRQAELNALAILNRYRINQRDMLFGVAYDAVHGSDKNNPQALESAKKFILFAKEYAIPLTDKQIREKQMQLKLKSAEEMIEAELRPAAPAAAAA